MSGVAESTKATEHDRRQEDQLSIENILSKLRVHTKIAYIRRAKRPSHISSTPAKPGIIVVELESADQRNNVLFNARQLRTEADCNGVFINPDLTPAESKLQYDLRQARKAINSAAQETDSHTNAIIDNRVRKVKRRVEVA